MGFGLFVPNLQESRQENHLSLRGRLQPALPKTVDLLVNGQNG
ncbi:hypothetical protein ACVIGB_000774 [Bradyrhizobium sp. USDA 4341]